VRRIFMLAGVTMVLLALTVGVAWAVEVAVDFKVKNCNNVPCKGTDNRDLLHEREGKVKDRIIAKGDRDVCDANNFRSDRDVCNGGPQGDVLLTNDDDGRDTARGGRGNDLCYIDPGDATRSCERVRESDVTPAVSELLEEVAEMNPAEDQEGE
jgi:hypothetical protein